MLQQDIKKEVRYLGKDFSQFRNALMNFAKIYYPDSYNDFNESSVGMMFLEMSAYVGDVLAYYLDSNLKESMLIYAEEHKNIVYLAQSLGYLPKRSIPASTYIDIYHQVPATGIDGDTPDFKYALKLGENMVVQSELNSNVKFRTTRIVDFSNYNTDGFVATVYTVNGTQPTTYLLKKTIPVVAGNIHSLQFTFTTPEQFSSLTIPYDDVVEILDVRDADGEKWYQVDFLAQDTIMYDELNTDFQYEPNPNIGTTTLQQATANSTSQPAEFVLKYRRVSKRFTVRRDVNGNTILNFGAGISSYPDQILVPNPTTVRYNSQFTFTDIANDFMNTRTYGHVPSDTILTVTFTRGGGIDSNVPQGDLNKVVAVNHLKTEDDFQSLEEKNIFARMKSSLAVINTLPATGGRDEESDEEVRQNAIAYFAAQDRCVTDNDYVVKILSMPEKYGNVSKIHVRQDDANQAVDIYLLGYDYQKKLTKLSTSTKQNVVTYVNHYRDLTTAINIKDAFIVNIGVKFSILTHPKYNKNEVVLKCIELLKQYFNIDDWQINQPIVLSDIYNKLDDVEGVRTVVSVDIENKYSTLGVDQYSNNYYYIKGATMDGVIYTSQDPMIFEVKYPNVDIEGISR